MRDAALSLARRFRVLPLWPILPSRHGDGFICGCGKANCPSPGKHPLGPLAPNGVKDATQDQRAVENWWRSRPDANIGIATGDGLAVLDVDPRHGGDATIAELQRKHGRLPQTLTVRTGGGGWHVYFACEREIANSAGALGAGLDVRGAGGFVVAPPSLHITGKRYEWRGDPNALMALLPKWVAGATPAKQKATRLGWRKAIHATVEEGRRNDVLMRLTGYLLRNYIKPEITLDLALCWNARHCKPPLDEGEVVAVVDSICGREKKRRDKNE